MWKVICLQISGQLSKEESWPEALPRMPWTGENCKSQDVSGT